MWYWIIYIIGYFVAYGVARRMTRREHPDFWQSRTAILVRGAAALLSWFLVLVSLIMLAFDSFEKWGTKKGADWL